MWRGGATEEDWVRSYEDQFYNRYQRVRDSENSLALLTAP
jgi:hypothetical protein